MLWALIVVLGIIAGTLGGVVGFGSSVIMLPALVALFGPKEAVPIMALASILANVSRVGVWWRDVDWRLTAVYCATAVPAAALGARLLVSLNAHLLEATLGVFLIVMIPARRWFTKRGWTIGLGGMAVVGAGIGFLTGLLATTGPINTPFFLAYGLVKGAFIATEAAGSFAVSLTKAAVFRNFGALPLETIFRGFAVGATLMLGSWLAKHIVLRFDAAQFRIVMEAMLLISGILLVWGALTTVQ